VLLLDQDATRIGLQTALENLARVSNVESSTVFIYFSGRGYIASGTNSGGYFLPVETPEDSAELIAQTAISTDEILTAFQHTRARQLLVVLDCSFAAGFVKPRDRPTFREAPEANIAILASSARFEQSTSESEPHSLFTEHFTGGGLWVG
jgi:uncharacterized caspase-like protein